MKIRTILCSTLGLALVAVGLTACVSEKAEQAKLEAKAKISRADAEKTALAKVNVPGSKIAQGEIENEKGKLVWSFDVATPDSKDITEVQVDALTGDVVSVAKETPEDQKKEKESEAKEKK